jgi:hypothetical protein
MKRYISLTVLVSLLSSMSLAANVGSLCGGAGSMFPPDDIILGEEIVSVEDVFAPKGFDTKDHIRIFLTGWKHDTGLAQPTGSIERDGSNIRITVSAQRRADLIDHGVPAHFFATIPLPSLPPGKYNIFINAETAARTQLDIADTTTTSIDDHLYANVETVAVDPKTRMVEISGENSSPCIVPVLPFEFISNGLNTYAMLPIMRKKEGQLCSQQLVPFKYSQRLPDDIQASKILVHVRSFDGNYKNKIFTPIR